MKHVLFLVLTCLAAATLRPSGALGDESAAKPRTPSAKGRATGPAALGLSRTGLSRYGWEWLAKRFDKNRDGEVSADELAAAPEFFTRLDRNWDGQLTESDFDWSPNGDLGRQRDATFALFKNLDEDSDGQISGKEWQSVFDRIAGEKEFLDDEQLENLIFRPMAQRNRSMGKTNFAEMTSIYDWAKPAPAPGEKAPDFELKTPSSDATVKLSAYRDDKPVVLIFGSFT